MTYIRKKLFGARRYIPVALVGESGIESFSEWEIRREANGKEVIDT